MQGRAGVERLVGDRRLDAVKPAAVVELARGSEGGAGDLLGVEGEGAEKGVVLAEGEGAGDGLGGEVVAES